MLPFTLEEATDVCEDFEDLIDTEFLAPDGRFLVVYDVCISPYDAADKKSFLEQYQISKGTAHSLPVYTGMEYDVLVLVHSSDDEMERSNIDIRTYAAENGVNYSFP